MARPGNDSGSLIAYPSAFPIKVMGAQAEGFVDAVVALARRFDPSFDAARVELRPSRGGNYLGITITVTATSREQLDALYGALTAHPMVKVVL
ncbi:MAG: DUF493 family protein [Ideonella sp.]|nr:DUF493 family protein [Ideonella sp.]MCC7457781.1 DUF493 family protein [Nitrospira sp.]